MHQLVKMQYDFYSWQSLPLSFMHWVTRVKPPQRFEPGSPYWEADDLPTELSLHPCPSMLPSSSILVEEGIFAIQVSAMPLQWLLY